MQKTKRILSTLLAAALLMVYLPLLQAAAAESYMWPVPRTIKGPSASSTVNYLNIRGGDNIVATKSGTVVYVYTGCKNYSALTTKKACSNATCSPNIGFYTNKDYNINLCNWGYGNGFVLKHSDGSGYSFYGHMGSVSVKANQTLNRGDIVGKMGGSGLSFDNNLYFAASTKYTKNGTYYYPTAANAIDVTKINYVYAPAKAAQFKNVTATNITNKSADFSCEASLNATYIHEIGLRIINPDGSVRIDKTVATITEAGNISRTYSVKNPVQLAADTQYTYYFYAKISARNEYNYIYGPVSSIKTLPPDPTAVNLDKERIDLKIGETSTIKASVLPENASQKVTWTSSDATVASVSADGVVTAKKAGQTLITAYTQNGITKTCNVYVKDNKIPATKITLNKTALTLIEGNTEKLTATLTPADTTDTVTWKSSDTAVATVTNGTVTAKKAGTATITVTSSSGKTASCTVTVNKKVIPSTSVALNTGKITLTEGDTYTLTATLTPADSTDTVTWSSSDNTVAAVANGKVTAKKPGTAEIKVTSSSGKAATCTVTVLKAAKKWTTANQYYFGNSSRHFNTNTYTVSDKDFNKLSNYVRMIYNPQDAQTVINYMTAMRYSPTWGGSCFGMSVTALLDFNEQISMTKNFDPDAASLYNIDSPSKNADVMSAINYYQISQKIPYLRQASSSYNIAHANWKEGLISLVKTAKNNNPFLFCYVFRSRGETSGHAVIIKSYGGTDNNGNHKLITYDNRYPENDIIILVDKNYTYCTVNGTEYCDSIEFLNDFRIYDRIDIDGPNNNMTFNSQAPELNTSVNTTDISVQMNGDITIWNDSGKSISIKDGKITSTMDIVSSHLIVNSTTDGNTSGAEIVFTVADSDAFTFESKESIMQATVLSSDIFAEVNTKNAYAATISSSDGISVSGEMAEYSVIQSVNDETCDMFTFSGVSSGVSSITYENGSIYVEGNNPGNINVGKFNGEDYQELVFQSTKENVSIQLSESSYAAGDVNNDKKVTATDARLALRCSVKLESYKAGSAEFKAADVNSDGKVTAGDARSILRASVGLEELKKK